MRRNFAYYSKFLFSHYKANGGVNMVRRITEDRKKTVLANKAYVANILVSVSKMLLHVKDNINVKNADGVLVTEITHAKSVLENILDEMVYEE